VPIDLPTLTGQIPRDVEQAILRLREAIEDQQLRAEALVAAVQALPAPLSIAEIQAALAPTGTHPLPTAALLNTTPAQTGPVPPAQPVPGQEVPNGYAAICPDGTRVQFPTEPPQVIFGSDAPIALPTFGMFVTAMSGSFGHLAICKSHSPGNAWLINRTGTITDLGPTHGNYPVGLRTDGTPVWQDTATTYIVGIGGSPIAIPAPYAGTSQGFLALDGAGDPIWTDAQFVTPIVLGGVPFGLASRDGDWTVGQSFEYLNFIAYHHATATLYLDGPTLNSPIAPRVAHQADGSCIVARSLPMGWASSATFMLYPP